MIIIKALIVFHGLCESKKQMFNILSKISRYYDTVICDDMPGHGNNTLEFNKENTLKYVIFQYDKVKNYDEIDVLGYSIGGVLAVFLQQIRKIDNLYLLTPALYYIFLGNLKFFKYKDKSKSKTNTTKSNKLIYFIEFVKITNYVRNEVNTIIPNTYLFIGEEDYLVSYKSVKVLFDNCISENKSIMLVPNTTHTSILNCEKVINNLEMIIKNK